MSTREISTGSGQPEQVEPAESAEKLKKREAPKEQMPLFPSPRWVSVPSGVNARARVAATSPIPAGTPITYVSKPTSSDRQLSGRPGMNPHLLAARRLVKRMRRLPDHSSEETRTGLAICQQLKAFLQDGTEPATRH